MTIMTTILTYRHHAMEAIHMGGQMWLRVHQIDAPLGFSDSRSVTNLYNRNSDEFTSDESRIVTLPTEGGPQEVRVFSLRGVRLLALLARTPEAKAFRRWVLDLLERRVRRQPVQAQLALPGTHSLPMDTVKMLDEVSSLFDAGELTADVLRELRNGARPVSIDPGLEHLAERFRGLRVMQGDLNRGYRSIAQEARRIGYSWEAVKLAARGELGANAV